MSRVMTSLDGPDTVTDRLGSSIRRRPGAWLAATLIWGLTIASSAAAVVNAGKAFSGGVTLAAVAFIAYVVVAWFRLPSVLVRRGRAPVGSDRVVCARWVTAMGPLLVGACAVDTGGKYWALVLGVGGSGVLLILAVITVCRAGRPA
jgi:hypothetical protein